MLIENANGFMSTFLIIKRYKDIKIQKKENEFKIVKNTDRIMTEVNLLDIITFYKVYNK